MNHVGSYWRGVTQRLQAEVEQMNQLIDHQGTKGTENELSLARMVQNLIPERYGVGSGLLIDADGASSKQMDLVVYERGNEPAMFAQTNQVLFPVESVRLCVEVKTTVTKSAIEDSRAKKASIEALRSSTSIRPPLALFGYRGDIGASTISDHLDTPTNEHGPRPDVTTVVDLALLVGTLQGYGSNWIRGFAGLQRLEGEIPVVGTVQEARDDDGTSVVRGNVAYPIVSIDETWLIGEPSRALLLFAEWVVVTLSSPTTPVMSAYIDETTRDLMPV